MKLGEEFYPSNPSGGTKNVVFSPKTSKFGSIHVNIRALFKRPLIPRPRRVHGDLLGPMGTY